MVLDMICFYGSVNTLIYKARSEFLHSVFVHLREHELVFVELSAYLLPKVGFTSSQGFPDICAVCPSITNEISVEFTRNCSGESPEHKDGVENGHAKKVVSNGAIFASIYES